MQAGGSSTANDALTRLVLQDSLAARWKFLSFEDTGSRITALLRDDANIMLGSASDVAEQVKAGQLKVIAVIGDSASTPSPMSARPRSRASTRRRCRCSSAP